MHSVQTKFCELCKCVQSANCVQRGIVMTSVTELAARAQVSKQAVRDYIKDELKLTTQGNKPFDLDHNQSVLVLQHFKKDTLPLFDFELTSEPNEEKGQENPLDGAAKPNDLMEKLMAAEIRAAASEARLEEVNRRAESLEKELDKAQKAYATLLGYYTEGQKLLAAASTEIAKATQKKHWWERIFKSKEEPASPKSQPVVTPTPVTATYEEE